MSATVTHRTLQLAAKTVGERANGTTESLRERLAPVLERGAVALGQDVILLLRCLASRRMPPTEAEYERAVQTAAHTWDEAPPSEGEYLLAALYERRRAVERKARAASEACIRATVAKRAESDRALTEVGLTAIRNAMSLHMKGKTHEGRALVVGLDPAVKRHVTVQVSNFLTMTEHAR